MNPVVIDPKIKGGSPVVTGTRITVKAVVYLAIVMKKNPEVIATQYYPQITPQHISQVISWYWKNKEAYGKLDF